MNVCMDWLAETAYSGRDPQFYVGEDSEDPESLEICKKEVQSLLRRCEDAGMTDYCYETLGPVLDRLGFIY